MPPVAIENPILNSPFREPARHFRFDENGITNEIAEGRRRSTYFLPIPKPKIRGGQQLSLPGADELLQHNDFINRVREHVAAWRQTRYHGITTTTRELLDYWTDPAREKPLFFCQIEALETAIFLAEVAGRQLPWIENHLREQNVRHAYFLGADDPYDKLRRALRADIDEAAWSSLNSTVSRPFPVPESGCIAVKVINHYGDEILKVYTV